MTFTLRPPTIDEAEQAQQLGHEAFGVPLQRPATADAVSGPGRHYVAAFDGPTLAGQMVDREYDSWFGGRLVPTSGIAGVAVAMEYRSRGLLRPLFGELFAGARARGAVISTLMPSAPGIYRGLGYEVVGTVDTVELPMAALSRITAAPEVVTRRAGLADVGAIRAIYDQWAQAQDGPLSRRGVSFPTTDEELLRAFTAITVAERGSEIIGYASWERGIGEATPLRIVDLLATEADGYRALLAGFATFASVVDRIRLETSGLDLIRALVPASDWQPTAVESYMLKILDVPGALTARGYPAALDLELEFGLRGDTITGTDGRYRFRLRGGDPQCTRIGDLDQPDPSLPTFTPCGLALAYAGSQSCAGIRTVGGLTGPQDDDATWGAAFGGRPFRVHDHF